MEGGIGALALLALVIGPIVMLWLLIGYGRIWLYTKQMKDSLKEIEKALKGSTKGA